MPTQKLLLASQPIYTVKKDIYGTELLFRHELFASACDYGEEQATSEVILNLCTGIGDQLNECSPKMFINLSEEFLYSNEFLPLPPDKVVIELPASLDFKDKLVDRIKTWRQAGFRFSLDDFDFDRRLLSILDDIDYIKVDALDQSLENDFLKRSDFIRPHLIWAVKRVETEEQYFRFKSLGFTLFQGYFLAKPAEVQGQSIRGKINNSITTINAASLPEIEIDEMVAIVSRDPSLATQLLKIVNSPACELLRPMKSIRDAVVFLGLIQVRKWIMMMSMLNDSASSVGAINLVLTRAKACENYAAITLSIRSDQAFLIGLLSGVKLLFGIEVDDFLKQLPLQEDVAKAILNHDGILGQVLKEIKMVEYQIMQQAEAVCEQDGALLSSYQEAHQWAEQVLSTAKAA
jgi:c-di-GMP phosphodiesterase